MTYLIRDEFATPDAAPITNPRTCEPGPGTLTVTDTGNRASVSGGELVFDLSSPTAWGEPGLWGSAQTRAAGLMLYAKWAHSSAYCRFMYGWDTDTSSTLDENAFHANNTTTMYIRVGTSSYASILNYALATSYDYVIVLRSSGAFYIVDNTLVWVANTGSTSTVYPAAVGGNVGGGQNNIDSLRVAQLPAPWNTDDGIATDAIASPIETDTFSHEADCIWEFVVDSIPTGGNRIRINFRQQDTSNTWRVFIGASGEIYLYEIVGGGATLRGTTSAGTLTGGERIVIVADDTTITGYYNNTQAWSYTSASNFKTQTGGLVSTLGDGAISALKTWPRTLSGAALTALTTYTT